MTMRSASSVQSIRQSLSKERSFRELLVVKKPERLRCPKIQNKMAALGFVIGYLGLVVLLASAPAWSQSLLLYQAPSLSCTISGGGR
ncbi:MAG: hypothetical protein ACRBM6_17435 [Geminicoccales bacterium]